MYSNGGIYIPDRKPPMGVVRNPHLSINRRIVGDWMMWEGGGSTVEDLSGNGNHGTEQTDSVWLPGKYGSCRYFSGDDCISLGDVLNMGTDSWTWIFHIKVNTYADPGKILDKRGGDSASILQFKTVATGFQFIVHDGTNWQFIVITESSTDWIHFAVVYDRANAATGFRAYQDGVLYSADLEQTVTDAINNAIPFGIGGAVAAGDDFQGLIDHVYIYNRALTASEIALLCREPFCGFRWTNIIELASYVAAAGGILPQITTAYMRISA